MSKPELDDQELKRVLGGMSEAELKQLIETSNGLASIGSLKGVNSFIPNEDQIPIANSHKKNVVVFGGNRCLGGETLIYDPVLGIERRVDEIDGPFHVYAWDGEKRVVAEAEAPFIKEPQDIYRITLEDGQWFTASKYHMVLTQDGWKSLKDLGITDSNSGMWILGAEKVEKLRWDFVFDFTVPIYHNYICAGLIHHNSGKSHIAAFIVSCHATGIYPSWWQGIRFSDPPSIGVVSITAEQLRKSSQKKLMGEFYNLGTGFIPKDKIIRTTSRQGVVGALDTALIRHVSGGITKIEFMLNEQGQEKFMGFEWNFCWGDEELDKEVFDEIKMRLLDLGGYMLLSFAPLKGQTDLIQHIDTIPEEYIDIFRLDWYSNPHLPKDAVAEMEATMSDSDKESRKLGRANYGEGRVFTFPPEKYTCDPFEVEPWWPVLGAIDPGYGHATGAVKGYEDPESGVIYITAEYWSKENTPIIHAPVFKSWGNMEFKLDRKSKTRDQTSGMSVMDMYLDLGLNVTEAETNAGSVEASIAMINTLIMQGKLQIFKTCRKLLDQMAMYRRAKNKSTGKVSIVMKDNDLIDPLRYRILHSEDARPMGVPKKMEYTSPKIVDFQPMDSRIGY